MFELTLLRHGQSEGVQRNILQGRLDLPLTGAGRQQVNRLAQRWRQQGRTFERIITSPQLRARQTAEIVAEGLGIADILEDALWVERDFGAAEGKDLAVVAAWYDARPRPTPFEPIYDSGEPEWDAHLRAGRALAALLAEPAGSCLVVSHGNILNAALHVIFGILPAGRALPVELALQPAHCARLHYDPAPGRWSLLAFNEGGDE